MTGTAGHTDGSEHSSRWEPTCLAEDIGQSSAWRVLLVDKDLGWFQGHFPGRPILSGMVQLTWAVSLLRSLTGSRCELLTVSQLKFRQPILPGHEVKLCIQLDRPGTASFIFRSQAGVHSSGRLEYRER